jgi:hypothetical protein
VATNKVLTECSREAVSRLDALGIAFSIVRSPAALLSPY